MEIHLLDLVERLCYICTMQNRKLTAKSLPGVWTALVTPFSRGKVNLSKISELVERAKDAELSGVVPLGSTGEAASLEDDERSQVITAVVKASSGEIPVMVGAGTNNTLKTIRNVQQAADLGADAVLIVTPYYSKPTEEGQKRHFLTVADASELPIVLYHIPSRCGVGIPLELVIELSRHPKIIGIKEAGGDVFRSGEIAWRTDDGFAVLSGDDPLTLALMSVGAVGVISVISNIFSTKFNFMVKMCLEDRYSEALLIHRELSPLLNALSLETNPAPIKEVMNIMGMKVGRVRPPLSPVTTSTRRLLHQAIELSWMID